MPGFKVITLACLAGIALAAPSGNNQNVNAARAAPAANKIVLTNDDGWAVAQVRAQFSALTTAGYNPILSAPAENQSGTGSLSKTPVVLTEPCEFDSCPTGSPATGSDPTNPSLNYVNAFPVDAAKFGIQTLAPQIFDGKPDFVVSGPNVGSNLGLSAFFSGTVGAASEAALEGIPSAAFSGASGEQVSFTTLTNTTSPNTEAAVLYSALTVKFLNVLLASSAPILPPNVALNVNYPAVTGNCTTVDAFDFVLTRLFFNLFPTDVNTCGTSRLPDESSVVGKDGSCQISVSVFNPSTKLDVNAATQAIVLGKLSSILSCSV
ncbi:sure-like protein [Mycena amicta]|nr:sure-like protein [Mycena amicta]